jgi:hypothetical protein
MGTIKPKYGEEVRSTLKLSPENENFLKASILEYTEEFLATNK